LKGIIIGGGIIGLSIARELNKLGYEITILEKIYLEEEHHGQLVACLLLKQKA
jgi:Glycine/D-amino acid oxidases (deaminating)